MKKTNFFNPLSYLFASICIILLFSCAKQDEISHSKVESNPLTAQELRDAASNQIQEKLQTLVALEKVGAPIRGSECNCFYNIKDVEFPSGIPLEGFEYNLYSSEACVPGQPSECNKFSWVFNSHLPDCDPSGAFPGCFDIDTQFGTFQAKKPFNCTVPPFSTDLPVTGLSIGLENDCLSSFPFEFPTVTINISCSNFINKDCNKETSYQSQDVVIDLGNDFTTYFETALFDLEGECGCTPVFTGFL